MKPRLFNAGWFPPSSRDVTHGLYKTYTNEAQEQNKGGEEMFSETVEGAIRQIKN